MKKSGDTDVGLSEYMLVKLNVYFSFVIAHSYYLPMLLKQQRPGCNISRLNI